MCEEKEKCRRLNERNIILERETNDLKNEVDSLTEIIRMLQTHNSPAEMNTDTSLVNDEREWQTSLKTANRKAPPESPTGLATKNKFLALQTENREEKNSTITDENGLFFLQMENVKMKRKLNYLENKVIEKQNRRCDEIDQEQYGRSSTNKEIIKGKKYPSTSSSKHDSKIEKTVEDQVVIVGDSIVKNIDPRGLSKKSKTLVKSYSGARCEDMLDFVKPIARRRPKRIIIHSGTNDVKSNEVNHIVELLIDISKIVKSISPGTDISFSSIVKRSDDTSLNGKIHNVNVQLKKQCSELGV